ncbi:MAG: twin-arginine translocation signal domain-containing protein [Alphaproteobacteria bacterium]|nr:twin-arginine translocation signal domain-containing protein [Alphaproteobacteria bacterium]
MTEFFSSRRRFMTSVGMGGAALGLLAACGIDPKGDEAADKPGDDAQKHAMKFEKKAKEFVERYKLDDGTVHPRHLEDHKDSKDPVDVYLLARRFSFEPGILKLNRGVAYRFHMMTNDVTHSVWFQPGDIPPITLRKNEPVEQTIALHRLGNHSITCNIYCGPGHDKMRIQVTVV